MFNDVSRVIFRGGPTQPPYDHLRLFLRADSDAGNVLDWRCERVTLQALPADAWLEAHGQDEAATWTGIAKPLEVLRCKDAAGAAGANAFEAARGEGALSFDFAKLPGVEWIFENSDMVAQAGAYRLLQ